MYLLLDLIKMFMLLMYKRSFPMSDDMTLFDQSLCFILIVGLPITDVQYVNILTETCSNLLGTVVRWSFSSSELLVL